MKFKSAKEVIEVARERGFDVRIKPGPPPMPFLHVPASADRSLATEALLGALKAWRLEIIEELSEKATNGTLFQEEANPYK